MLPHHEQNPRDLCLTVFTHLITLTLVPREEFQTMAPQEASTSKPKPITQDAIMDMMHQTTNAGMKKYLAYPIDLDVQPLVQRRRHAPRCPKSWPVGPVPDLDPYSGPSSPFVPLKVLVRLKLVPLTHTRVRRNKMGPRLSH